MFLRFRYSHMQFDKDGQDWCAEASELGLAPGQWPDVFVLQLDHGKERTLHPWRVERSPEGETLAVVYRSQELQFSEITAGEPGHVIRIFND